MCIFPACIYVLHVHTWSVLRSEEGSDPLKVELQVVVSHYVGVRLKPKSSRAILPALRLLLLFVCFINE